MPVLRRYVLNGPGVADKTEGVMYKSVILPQLIYLLWYWLIPMKTVLSSHQQSVRGFSLLLLVKALHNYCKVPIIYKEALEFSSIYMHAKYSQLRLIQGLMVEACIYRYIQAMYDCH